MKRTSSRSSFSSSACSLDGKTLQTATGGGGMDLSGANSGPTETVTSVGGPAPSGVITGFGFVAGGTITGFAPTSGIVVYLPG